MESFTTLVGVDALMGRVRVDVDSSLELLRSLGLSCVSWPPLPPLEMEVRGFGTGAGLGRAALTGTGGVLLPRLRVKKSLQFLFMESSFAKTPLPLGMLGEDG